jgi:hypothetical protein
MGWQRSPSQHDAAVLIQTLFETHPPTHPPTHLLPTINTTSTTHPPTISIPTHHPLLLQLANPTNRECPACHAAGNHAFETFSATVNTCEDPKMQAVLWLQAEASRRGYAHQQGLMVSRVSLVCCAACGVGVWGAAVAVSNVVAGWVL